MIWTGTFPVRADTARETTHSEIARHRSPIASTSSISSKANGENEIKSPSHDVDSRFLALNLCHVWDSRPEHSKLDDGNDDGFEASTFVSNREECAAGRLRSPSSSSSSENDNKRRFGAERRRYDGEFSAEFRKRGGGGGGGKRFSRPVLFLLHLEKRRGDFDKIDVSGHGHRNGGRSASVQRSETETSAGEVYDTKRSDDDLSGTHKYIQYACFSRRCSARRYNSSLLPPGPIFPPFPLSGPNPSKVNLV